MERNISIESSVLSLCERLGWCVEVDNAGQILLYTGLQYSEDRTEIEEFNVENTCGILISEDEIPF